MEKGKQGKFQIKNLKLTYFWNSLPSDLRQAESVSAFSHLLNSFYPRNFCIFRHGIHVKQFLWFYFFGFGLDVGLDIVS